MTTLTIAHQYKISLVLAFVLITLPACGPRVVISTGTTIGLKATPGDGNTRPPQVTFAYKRAELALIPTKSDQADNDSDAFSTLAAMHFSTRWFGKTEIRSVVGTGFAAREIQGQGTGGGTGKSGGMEALVTKPTESEGFWRNFRTTAEGGTKQ